jgi:hypothetical protein
MKEPNIPVNGKTIGGRNLKKLFEYYFEYYTRYDKHDVEYRGVSRLKTPVFPYTKEVYTIEACINSLDLRDEWNKYFIARKLNHPYWIERESKTNQSILNKLGGV